MRIIVVEDEKVTRQWVKKQIEKLDPDYYEVEVFANGRQALGYMESHAVEVLFTDIRMPVMDGLELLGELRRRDDRSYKVILSAYDEFHYAQQALRLGANEFTLKPEITKEELERILGEAERYLKKRRGLREEAESLESLREKQESWMRRVLEQGMPIQDVQGMSAREVWEKSAPEVREESVPEVWEESAREVQEESVPEVQEESVPEVREESAREVRDNPPRPEDPDCRNEWSEEQIAAGMREHGIGLDPEGLMAACISFSETVPGEKVMELLQLYLEEEKVNYFCLRMGVQSFYILFNQTKLGTGADFGERLWELLRVHIGTDVYIGMSARGNGYKKIRYLCSQAAAAKRNRQFFGISGCRCYEDMRIAKDGCRRTVFEDRAEKPWEMRFEKPLREILDVLESRDYGRAKEMAGAFFDEIGKAHDLPPAYVVALGREILTGYIRLLRVVSPDGEESARLRQCELMLGKYTPDFREFRGEMMEAVRFLSDVLEKKEKDSGFSPAVRRMAQYVEEHYGERISLEQVAAAAFLSKSYASVLFKKETGEKFSEYLQKVRLEKACLLLGEGGISVQEAARRTGFFDTAHFSRVFKEKMGMSPMEYRKKAFRYKKA